MGTIARLAVLTALATIVGVSHSQPIDASVVASLLPETPRTPNETVAAIVQDPVVQNAVLSVVGDGELAGLVVKKNIVILPANDPQVVLSHTEQILTPPVSDLEDIRKNITEAANATEEPNNDLVEVDEFGVAELEVSDSGSTPALPLHETHVESSHDDEEQSTVQDGGNLSNEKEDDHPLGALTQISEIGSEQKFEAPGIGTTAIKLPDGVIPQHVNLPKVVEDKISVPVVAVLNPLNVINDNLQGSVIALLPSATSPVVDHQDESTLGTELRFLNENQEKISMEIGDFVSTIPISMEAQVARGTEERPALEIEDGRSLSVDEEDVLILISPMKNDKFDYGLQAEYRKVPDISVTPVGRLQEPSTKVDVLPEENILAIFAVPEESSGFMNRPQDMAVAEDIIFRPLFRFRQEEKERARTRTWLQPAEARGYPQKATYRRYRPRYSTYGIPYRNRYYNNYAY